MEHDDLVRNIHDASVALGAQCDSSCVFNDVGGAIDQVKSYTAARDCALSFVQRLTN